MVTENGINSLVSGNVQDSAFVCHFLMKGAVYVVVNASIHTVLILPSCGYYKDKSLSFTFAPQKGSGFKLGNSTVQFPYSAQLTCTTDACGK